MTGYPFRVGLVALLGLCQGSGFWVSVLGLRQGLQLDISVRTVAI